MSDMRGIEELKVEEINSLPANGLMRVQTPYVQAVKGIEPRSIESVIKRCEAEAAHAGDDFYYSWKQGGGIIEGISIGGALAIARNFGNALVDVVVEETPFSYIFTASFVDVETGFNLRRAYRQNKQSPKTRDGKDVYSGERGTDIIFQIGQSKAIRNVVANAVPKWLISKVIEKAKENVGRKIEAMGIEAARQAVLRKMESLGITKERYAPIYDLPEKWDKHTLINISGNLRQIENGSESVNSLFPERKQEQELEAVPQPIPEKQQKAKKEPAPKPAPEPAPEPDQPKMFTDEVEYTYKNLLDDLDKIESQEEAKALVKTHLHLVDDARKKAEIKMTVEHKK